MIWLLAHMACQDATETSDFIEPVEQTDTTATSTQKAHLGQKQDYTVQMVWYTFLKDLWTSVLDMLKPSKDTPFR